MGHSPAGIFGYSHLLGGYAGGQAEYVRVPFADVGPVKVPDDVPDESALMLADVFPTGYMGAEMCDINPGDVVAVWGAGPVGLLAAASARLLGAERVIVIDRYPYRLRLAERARRRRDDQLRGARRPRHPQPADRRPGPGRLHRRRRPGGAPRQRRRLRVRPGQAGDPHRDRTALRAAPGDPRLPQRGSGQRHRRVRRIRRQVPDGRLHEPLADHADRAVSRAALHPAAAGAHPRAARSTPRSSSATACRWTRRRRGTGSSRRSRTSARRSSSPSERARRPRGPPGSPAAWRRSRQRPVVDRLVAVHQRHVVRHHLAAAPPSRSRWSADSQPVAGLHLPGRAVAPGQAALLDDAEQPVPFGRPSPPSGPAPRAPAAAAAAAPAR